MLSKCIDMWEDDVISENGYLEQGFSFRHRLSVFVNNLSVDLGSDHSEQKVNY